MSSEDHPFLTVTAPGERSLHQYSSEKAAELGDLWSRIADLDLAQAALERLRHLGNSESDIVIDASRFLTPILHPHQLGHQERPRAHGNGGVTISDQARRWDSRPSLVEKQLASGDGRSGRFGPSAPIKNEVSRSEVVVGW